MTPLSEDDTVDEQVRRLLADARHTEPLPPDVAARLDGALADLRADRPVRPAVTDLAAARRRRRARTLLLAAAAVVVVGIGVDQVRQGGMSDSDSASSDDAGGSVSAERPPAAEDAPTDGLSADEAAPEYDAGGVPPRVTAGNFGAAAARLREQRGVVHRDTGSQAYLYQAKGRCLGPDPVSGELVPIRYDGSPAVLVYRPPRGDTQVVDLYLCGHDGVVRTITLPAR